jgi:hypothetical protein
MVDASVRNYTFNYMLQKGRLLKMPHITGSFFFTASAGLVLTSLAESNGSYPGMHIGDSLANHQTLLNYFEKQTDEV